MRLAVIRPVLALSMLAAPIAAAEGASDLAVLPQGRYACWTAGAATGPAVIEAPEHSFTIERGSIYRSMAGSGIYLLASDLLTFTRGPLRDIRLRRNREGFWQQIARDGELGRLKCSRAGVVPTPS